MNGILSEEYVWQSHRSLNVPVSPLGFRSESDLPVDGRRGVWIAERRCWSDQPSVRGPTVTDRGPTLLWCARPRVSVLFPRANQGHAVGRRLDQ